MRGQPGAAGPVTTDSWSSTGAGASGAIRRTAPSTSVSSRVSPTTSSSGRVMTTLHRVGHVTQHGRQRAVDVLAHHVHRDQVQFLDHLAVRDGQHSASSQASASGFGPGPVSAHVRMPRLRGGRAAREQVRAAAAGRQQQQHVAGPAVRAHLPGEHLLEAVVVADRGHRRRVRRERDRGQRRAVVA